MIYFIIAAALELTVALVMSARVMFYFACFDDAYVAVTTLKQLLAMSASFRLRSIDALLFSWFQCMFFSEDPGCS